MFHRLSIHDSVLELLHDGFVDSIALTFYQHRQMNQESTTYKILDATSVLPQHDRRVVVWRLAFRLRIDTPELELLPHLLQQLINIPAVLSADGTRIGNPVYEVELFD